MKRVLVTGGAGFIGSHLCKRLLDDGCEVTCLDNLSTGLVSNVRGLSENGRFKLLVADVSSASYSVNVPRVDEIYNLACPASPVHYKYEPISTIRTNLDGVASVLDLARICQARVLQASTSEIYGDPLQHPQTEDYWGNVNPIGPRSCYDEGKRCAESLFFDYHRQYGTRIKVARIFNTYGPGMAVDDGRVVSNFIVQALRGEPLTVYGNGTQTRSFCYIDDMIEGLVRLMATGDEVTGPINLGNPSEITVRKLARLVAARAGSRQVLLFEDLPADDPLRRCPDITKARAILDWGPKVELADGLVRTINYFRDQLEEAA
ncbi:MAG TPA: SDR family oxidoreductase [Marinobacter sp.]|nr:SDR family oxidoreductase [Marinobacter sp.]